MTEEPLKVCMRSPNEPVTWVPDSSTADLNKVHNSINKNTFEGTEWKTWGILSREGCAKGQLRLVIGSVIPISSITSANNLYVFQSHFEKFKKGMEDRLSSIEQGIKNLTSPSKK